jgi:hypothetical protein
MTVSLGTRLGIYEKLQRPGFLDDEFEDKSLRRFADVLVLGDCGEKHRL